MKPSLLLSIDNGTQSLRAILFDRQGNIQGKTQIPYPAPKTPSAGYTEQSAKLFWQTLCNACNDLWQLGHDPNAVAAISVTSQRGSIVPIDKDGEPLHSTVLWTDQRKANQLDAMPLHWQSLFTLARVDSPVKEFRSKAFCNWFNQHHSELAVKVHKWLLISGYLNYKLTGKFVDSASSQVGYIPFDYKKIGWAGSMSWRWHALKIKHEHLPSLVRSGEKLGELCTDAASQTGLNVGLPVVASGADKACEVLGSGGIDASVACLSFGTTATVNVNSPRYAEAIKHMPAFPSILPNEFNHEVMLYRGFWMVNWFKEQFGLAESLRAEQSELIVEDLFDELVEAVPPGAMGLMLQPYWGAGVREPGPEAKGAIIGFGDIHKREHLYRAIIEGLNFGLRDGLEKIRRNCRVNPEKLRISGGGSVSNAAMQIAADIFGMTAERPHTCETSALGAAIAMAKHIGWYDNMRTAAANMVHTGEIFTPNHTHQRIYDEMYKEVYLTMYQRLQPLYQKIQRITGYPD